ncbi:MAG: hypothetical protein NT069_14760 [Planctomycetota bacterium]|nr:hypothetical protein [Planctomycetota bacterium]
MLRRHLVTCLILAGSGIAILGAGDSAEASGQFLWRYSRQMTPARHANPARREQCQPHVAYGRGGFHYGRNGYTYQGYGYPVGTLTGSALVSPMGVTSGPNVPPAPIRSTETLELSPLPAPGADAPLPELDE